ncbi:craniofacial development protein 2-like [Penaeus indicus]|uniref:craniofacial development protein 2-like n=1 Tax=Penaeus indicus TaxID=29960 RepID=UPI00300CD2ED
MGENGSVQKIDELDWHIIGISEMRWKGIGEGTTEDGHKICERIAAARIAGDPFNITIIQVYAPTSDCSEESIEEFYEDLEKLIRMIHRKDICVVQRDWNTKIGNDAFDGLRGTVGRFGMGKINDREQKLLEFAKRYQLTAINTLFNHKTSRKATWHSPDGKVHNQIDYIFILRSFVTGDNRARMRTFNKPRLGDDDIENQAESEQEE